MAGRLLDLQRQAGNQAVTALVAVQRAPNADDAKKSAITVPDVPIIGPTPTAVTKLPPTAAGDQGTTLGETKVVKTDPPRWSVVGEKTKEGWTGKPQETTVGGIDIAATHPGPNIYPFGAGRLVVDDAVSLLIKAGEQEHSNDLHLAYHALYGLISAAINKVASQPAVTAKDRDEAEHALRKALCKELPGPLKPHLDGAPPNGDWSQRWAALVDLTLERDRKHWHDMNHAGALPQQRKQYHVANGEPLDRIIPADSIGKHGSQERLDAAAPWLKPKGGG